VKEERSNTSLLGPHWSVPGRETGKMTVTQVNGRLDRKIYKQRNMEGWRERRMDERTDGQVHT
jgi:hypothetical protein